MTLTMIGLLPLIGALVISALPKANDKLVKQVALATTIFVALASYVMAAGFDRKEVGLQFYESYNWISSFGIKYAVGVDGIALVLILLSVTLKRKHFLHLFCIMSFFKMN